MKRLYEFKETHVCQIYLDQYTADDGSYFWRVEVKYFGSGYSSPHDSLSEAKLQYLKEFKKHMIGEL